MTGIGIAEILLLISCSLGLFVGIVGIFLLVLLLRQRSTNQAPSQSADHGALDRSEDDNHLRNLLTNGQLPMSGDHTGTFPSPKVTSLQGNPVSTAQPIIGQVLVWNGTEWEPQDPP